MTNMEDPSTTMLTFQVQDYVVWAAILLLSLSVGIFFAFIGGRQRSTEEYLVGNRQMHPIPVAVSIAGSFISAVTFLGTPSEAYTNGVMIWLHATAISLACLLGGVIFLPVFHRLKLTSANEVRKAC